MIEMNKTVLLISIVFVIGILICGDASAQVAFGGLESKVQGLTQKLVSVILPLFSILGLVYAVILALSGDVAAKARITTVIICSVVGFLAPQIIGWVQSAVGH